MCEFFCKWWNILYKVGNNINSLVDGSRIFLNIVTGVSIIKGIGYLKKLKEKTNSATFNFWSQFRARLWEILSWLKDDYSLLDNMYDPIARRSWQSNLAPAGHRVEDFKQIVIDLLEYIKSTPDQMPAYKGWTIDYNFIVSFLNDIIEYDILVSDKYFKYKGQIPKTERDKKCEEICAVMEKLCKGITDKQIQIEDKIL